MQTPQDPAGFLRDRFEIERACAAHARVVEAARLLHQAISDVQGLGGEPMMQLHELSRGMDTAVDTLRKHQDTVTDKHLPSAAAQ